MKCLYCECADTQVTDSRVLEDGTVIRRRRRCVQCERRFVTFERIERTLPVVIKRDGSRMEYQRTKVRESMLLALRKRPVTAEVVEHALNNIEQSILTSGMREVSSVQIGETVMSELRLIDKVAYVRFASVYEKFEDIEEFANVIRDVGSES